MPRQPSTSAASAALPNTLTGTSKSAQEKITDAVSDLVMRDPDGDVNYLETLNQFHSDPDVNLHKVTAALLQMERRGMLVEDRREKVDRPEAKDRKVIQYRPTQHFKQLLGLAPPLPTKKNATQSAGEILKIAHEVAVAGGFVCRIEDLANLFLCLQAKPFVILSGISGTGKTRLPRAIAEAIGAKSFLVPVKPNWTDNSDLMGYYSITQDDFVPGRLLQIIRMATSDPDSPYFVILDEMNLAHVEHYMSDILSIMETRRRKGGEIITDPLPLELPPEPDSRTADTPDEWASLRAIALPWNLFLIGTVNVDETTHPFSRKVLDRAFAVDFNEVNLLDFAGSSGAEATPAPSAELVLDRPLSIQEVYQSDPEFFHEIANELSVINEKLRQADLHFAYRVRDEISLYMWAWKRHKLAATLSRNDALDYCLLQKVLPRCQGSSETARRALEEVFRITAVETKSETESSNAIASVDEIKSAAPNSLSTPLDPSQIREPAAPVRWRYPRTARKAWRMLQRYSDTGHFAFWS
jgi:5-methylcytosine-specific restriction protein B